MEKRNYYLGAMTGTSLDGIDIALLGFDVNEQGMEQGRPELVGHYFAAYPASLRQEVLDISQGQSFTMQQLASVEVQVARYYVEHCKAFLAQQGMEPSQIKALGAHGQTVHHQPLGLGEAQIRYTLQLGEPNTMAVGLGFPVVADFRRRDMALGGQGAPLACGFHDIVFRDPHKTRVILNLGGIANITVLKPEHETFGYDTGPANILMDAWISQHLGKSYDAGGDWASTGQLNAELLHSLLGEPYFALDFPKSTGRELFNLAWLQVHLVRIPNAKPEDVQRCLLELTAQSVAAEVKKHANLGEILVCGGGAQNPLLLERIAALCPAWQVLSTADAGFAPDTVEAAAFAVFAQRCLRGLPANIPAVTGASRPCVIGTVYYP